MADLSLRHIYKIYSGDVTAVKDFNLEIADKEFIVFVGPSGCGKSTTLRMIAGLEEISKGELYIGGKLVNDVEPKERDIAMVFQNYALYPHMTVYDNMAFALKLRKAPKDEIDRKVRDAAKKLDIEHLLDRKPKALSGGQRQRVALGRAIVREPKVFLMDEPLSNLDAKLRVQMRTVISKLYQDLATTFIYVTHDQVEAMTVGDRIALMNKGKLQMIDTPYNVYNRPRNIFTAKFIGSPSTNIFDVYYSNGCITLGDQTIELTKEWSDLVQDSGIRELSFGIRPEHIKLNKIQKKNSFKGCVKYIEDYGNKAGVYFDVDGNEIIAVLDENHFKSGDTVYFAPDFKRIHLFDRETTNSLGYPEFQVLDKVSNE